MTGVNMAEEDSEARRMSEIADAINTILQNDPAEPQTTPQEAAPQPMADPASGDDLDAAIAAEFAPEAGTETDPETEPGSEEATKDVSAETDGADAQSHEGLGVAADDPFGPPATLDTDATHDRSNNEPDTDVDKPQKDSDLSLLSLRMQETLSDLQSGNDHGDGTRELLQDMKLVRAQVMADVRQEIENLAEATRDRQAMIHEEMRHLEAQSQMVRDAVEIQLIKFETALDELHQKYFKNAEAERIRMDRYREFLQFLLKERDF
jgi:hypothetical protein